MDGTDGRKFLARQGWDRFRKPSSLELVTIELRSFVRLKKSVAVTRLMLPKGYSPGRKVLESRTRILLTSSSGCSNIYSPAERLHSSKRNRCGAAMKWRGTHGKPGFALSRSLPPIERSRYQGACDMSFGWVLRSLFSLPPLAFRSNAFPGIRKPEPRHRLALSLVGMLLLCGLAWYPLYAQTAYFAGAVTTLGGGFAGPNGVAVDASGNVYVADTGNNAVEQIPVGCASSSCVVMLGGGFNQPYGIAVDGSGYVYVADYGNTMCTRCSPPVPLPPALPCWAVTSALSRALPWMGTATSMSPISISPIPR